MWASFLSLGLRLFVGLLIIGFAGRQFVESPPPTPTGPKFISHSVEEPEPTDPQGIGDYIEIVTNTVMELFVTAPPKEAPKSSLEQLRQRNSL